MVITGSFTRGLWADTRLVIEVLQVYCRCIYHFFMPFSDDNGCICQCDLQEMY